jgi:hypothetical protein
VTAHLEPSNELMALRDELVQEQGRCRAANIRTARAHGLIAWLWAEYRGGNLDCEVFDDRSICKGHTSCEVADDGRKIVVKLRDMGS